MKNPFGTRQADVDAGGDGSAVVVGLGRFGRAPGVQPVQDGRTLTRLGVHHVVYPEADTGRGVAHRLSGGPEGFVEIGSSFAMVTTSTPAELVGRPLGTTGLRRRHDVTVVAPCADGGGWRHVTGETVLGAEGSVVVVAGAVGAVERFAAPTRRT